MSIPQSSTPNLLLRAMSPGDYALLEPHLERGKLELRATIFRPGEPIERVYFPEGGVCSIVSSEEGGDLIEVGLYGHEGMSGAPILLQADQSPHLSMVQVPDGPFLSLPAQALRDACEQSPELRALLLRYVHTLSVQAALTAAANAHYALPERLARWLLMCHDRIDGDLVDLTHEFIAMMLAVRRAGVTVTLHTLEATGAIRSIRGLVTIRSRERLEEIAGQSYGGAEAEYRRLIAPFGKTAVPS